MAALEPADIQDKNLFFEKFDLMLAMAQLAFESDSTRIVTLLVDAFATPFFSRHPGHGTTGGHHDLNQHGQHIAFRRDNNTPLSNLFVTMLHRLGVETDSFASSTGPIDTLLADATSA